MFISEFNDFSMSNWCKIQWFFRDVFIFTNSKNFSWNSMIFPWSWKTSEFQWFFKSCGNPGKQWWGWWFETPSRSLWRHCNGLMEAQLCRASMCSLFISWTINCQNTNMPVAAVTAPVAQYSNIFSHNSTVILLARSAIAGVVFVTNVLGKRSRW